MRVNVHIERLVLDGLPIAAQQGPMIQEAVQAELAQLLIQSNSLQQARGGATPVIRAPGFQIGGRIISAHLGRQIAESVYSSITR